MSEDEPRKPGRPVTTGTTPKRGLRIPADLWDEITTTARAEGADTATLTREFYAWYLRRPGARMPKRPEARR